MAEQKNYKVFHVMKNGDVVEETEDFRIKVPVNEETEIFYNLIASITKDKLRKQKSE